MTSALHAVVCRVKSDVEAFGRLLGAWSETAQSVATTAEEVVVGEC